MGGFFRNFYFLTQKELLTLYRDKVMFFFLIYSFSFAIYVAAGAASMELRNVPIAFVDEDRSAVSKRIIDSFYKPHFLKPDTISFSEIDSVMDSGRYTFVVVIPDGFEHDLHKKEGVSIQLNIDATKMSQAGIGASYISQIVSQQVQTFLKLPEYKPQIELVTSYMFNPNIEGSWFGSINEVISNIMMFAILLSGAALMREREHATIEHLLVMPIRSVEILLAKILSTTIVVLLGVIFAIFVVVGLVLNIPLSGSITLFLFATVFVLFATSSIGIFLATITSSMPQFGMMFILVVLPLLMLSGGVTPYESMPVALQYLMYLSPTTHFIDLAQAILFRGAGLETVYFNILAIFVIGVFFFAFTLLTFKKNINA